jgi:hypothetical protein
VADDRPSDWRIRNQEEYLASATLVRRRYRQYERNPNWDHDHCDFCGETFSLKDPQAIREGYSTVDEYHWICPSCFEDFKTRFRWTVVDASDA